MNPTHRPVSGARGPAEDGADPWAHVHRVVAQSGTSFLWGMRVQAAERRRAVYAIYAFCREVDDVGDEPGELVDKKRALAAWREEIALLFSGTPRRPTTKALLQPVRRFDLPEQEFLAIIDGVEIDTVQSVRMADLDDLLQYCRKVAGAVGMLLIRAFGVPEHPAPRVAETLGYALQLTNILRDLRKDAGLQRIYLPMDMLARHGVPTHSASAALAHPGLADVCAELAAIARGYYGEADRLLTEEIGYRRMRPAVVMMKVYRETLDLLEKRGWNSIDSPVRVTQFRKIWLGLRYGLF